jgi:uncharacterized protein (DUF433 family)
MGPASRCAIECTFESTACAAIHRAEYNDVMSTATYPHIEQRTNGSVYIAGSPFKVRQIVLDHVAYGWAAEQIQREHPQLTLGQIHSALAYYYDHQRQMDEEIEAGRALAEELRAKQGTSRLASNASAAGRELP